MKLGAMVLNPSHSVVSDSGPSVSQRVQLVNFSPFHLSVGLLLLWMLMRIGLKSGVMTGRVTGWMEDWHEDWSWHNVEEYLSEWHDDEGSYLGAEPPAQVKI